MQISRTSSIIDIVVPSKMAAGGHFVKKFKRKKGLYRSGMARNAIESDFRTSILDAGGHFVQNLKQYKKFRINLTWPEMRSKVNFGISKWPIDLKWPEMRSKVNFGHPQWLIDLKWPEM